MRKSKKDPAARMLRAQMAVEIMHAAEDGRRPLWMRRKTKVRETGRTFGDAQ